MFHEQWRLPNFLKQDAMMSVINNTVDKEHNDKQDPRR